MDKFWENYITTRPVDSKGAFEEFKQMNKEPRSTALGPRNTYQDGQLVTPSVDGSRPGYEGKKERPGRRINPERNLTWQEKEARHVAKHGKRYKTTKVDFTFEGKKISIDVKGMKPQSKGLMKDLLKGIEKWKVDPTTENWLKIFRKKKKSSPSYKGPQQYSHGWSADLRKYMQGKETTNALTKNIFDQLDIKKTLGLSNNEVKMIKSYVELKDSSIGFRIAAEKKLRKSFENIIEINNHFKTNPNMDLDQLTKKIYKSAFTKADDAGKLRMTTSVSDDVAKYLEALKGSREIPKGLKSQWKPPTGKNLDFITDRIFDQTKGFRFQDFTMRKYKYSIRDSMLNLRPGTTYNLEKTLRLTKGVLDHTVGLSATFDIAPGYTELYQNLEAAANTAKGNNIDKPFGEALRAALEKGDFSKVDEYNKIAAQWQKKNPGVDVPYIRKGGDPRELISYFDDMSPEAQKNVLKIAGGQQGLAIETKGMPIKSFKEAVTNSKRGGALLTNDILSKSEKYKNVKICKTKFSGGGGGLCGKAFADKYPQEYLDEVMKDSRMASYLKSKEALAVGKSFLSKTAKVGRWANPLTLVGGEAWWSTLAGINEFGKGKSLAESVNEGLWFIPGKHSRDLDMLLGSKTKGKAGRNLPVISNEVRSQFDLLTQFGDLINKEGALSGQLAMQQYETGRLEDVKAKRLYQERFEPTKISQDPKYFENLLGDINWSKDIITPQIEKRLSDVGVKGQDIFEKWQTADPTGESYSKLQDRIKSKIVDEFNIGKTWDQADPYSGPIWNWIKTREKIPFTNPELVAKQKRLDLLKEGPDQTITKENIPPELVENFLTKFPEYSYVFEGASGGRAGYMGGGIAAIRKPNALPPTGGPQSGGLPSLYNNGRKL